MAQKQPKILSKYLKYPKISSIDKIIHFMKKSFDLIGGDYIKCNYNSVDNQSIIFHTTKCFAFEGITKLGVISDYECGIFERIEGWFDYFKINYTKEPDDLACLMHKNGTCLKKYFLFFNQ